MRRILRIFHVLIPHHILDISAFVHLKCIFYNTHTKFRQFYRKKYSGEDKTAPPD